MISLTLPLLHSDEESDDDCEQLEKHEDDEEESSDDVEISSEDSESEVGMGDMIKTSYDEEVQLARYF